MYSQLAEMIDNAIVHEKSDYQWHGFDWLRHTWVALRVCFQIQIRVRRSMLIWCLLEESVMNVGRSKDGM